MCSGFEDQFIFFELKLFLKIEKQVSARFLSQCIMIELGKNSFIIPIHLKFSFALSVTYFSDIFITIGVILLLFDNIFNKKNEI